MSGLVRHAYLGMCRGLAEAADRRGDRRAFYRWSMREWRCLWRYLGSRFDGLGRVSVEATWAPEEGP